MAHLQTKEALEQELATTRQHLIDLEIKQKQTEATLDLQEIQLETLRQLNRMGQATLHEIAHFAMEQAVKITASKIGYLAFMNKDETVLTMYGFRRRG